MNRQYGALSGAAIVLIVLNHAVEFGLQLSPAEGGWLNALQFLQALGVFAVPAFLFISGAFLSYAARELSLSFVRSNLERLLWPYVIWSIVFYLLLAATTVQYSVPGYIKNLLVGYPYHFIPLLIFWYVSAPIVIAIARRHAALLLLGIALVQFLLIVLRFPRAFGLDGPFPEWVTFLEPPVLFTTMADWAIYFPLGLVLGIRDAAIKPWLVKLRWLAVTTTVVLFFLAGLNGLKIISAPLARLAVPLPLMFLLPIISRSAIPFARRLEVLGRRSYGIYLGHFVVINLLGILLNRPALTAVRVPWLVYPVLFVASLGVPFLMMEFMTTGMSARVYRYLFGIVPPAPQLRRPVGAQLSR